MLRWALGLALLGVSAVTGAYFASQIGPERLRYEVLQRVERELGAPCELAALEIRPGLPIEFVGRGLSLWDGAVEVGELTARVNLAAALVGKLHLTRLEVSGIQLFLRGGDGQASPPWFGPRGEEGEAQPAVGASVEAFLRELMAAPLLSDKLFVEDGRVELVWQRAEESVTVVLGAIRGGLTHSRLSDQSVLILQSQIGNAGSDRGRFELEAVRDGEDLRAGLALSGLDLDLLQPWFGPDGVQARGRVDGVIDVEAPADGEKVFQVEVLGQDLEGQDSDGKLWSASQARLRGRADVSPARVRLRKVRMQSGPLSVNLHAAIARPIEAGADLDLSVRMADLERRDVPALLETFPPLSRWVSKELLDSLLAGRITSLATNGAGTFAAWRAMLDGKTGGLRRPLRFKAAVEGLRIQLDSDDALEDVSFEVALRGDHLSVSNARGDRRGHPLPGLTLEVDGLSKLQSAQWSERVSESDGDLLLGLPLLLSLFEPDPERPTDFRQPHVEVSIAHFDHPILFWPVGNAQVGIDGIDGGLVAQLRQGTWAGVPVRGEVVWRNEPQKLEARLSLGDPSQSALTRHSGPPGAGWSRGSFEVGVIETRVWSHAAMLGEFRVVGSKLRFTGVEGRLIPTGELRGAGEIDLGQVDSLPYRFEVDGRDLDADTLLTQTGLGAGLVRGNVELRGEIRGRYEPGVHPLEHLGGQIDIEARRGTIRHDLPAVLALSLANDLFRLNRDRDHVRYDVCKASLEAEEGVVRTEALELDGPDVRLFGSGTLDLGHAPHPLDAEVAVFLFRPVDRALGTIPLVGNFLLGGSDNLVAAYYQLSGPWGSPKAQVQPLRSFYTGPMRVVGKLPGVVLRGIEALGEAFTPPKSRDPEEEESP